MLNIKVPSQLGRSLTSVCVCTVVFHLCVCYRFEFSVLSMAGKERKNAWTVCVGGGVGSSLGVGSIGALRQLSYRRYQLVLLSSVC